MVKVFGILIILVNISFAFKIKERKRMNVMKAFSRWNNDLYRSKTYKLKHSFNWQKYGLRAYHKTAIFQTLISK